MESELSQEYRAEGFRVNDKIRNKLAQSKRRIERRLDKNDNTGCRQPMFTTANIHYEIADRTRAIAAGGMGAMHLVAKKLGLAKAIDRDLHLLKIHMPDSRVGPRIEHPLQSARRRHVPGTFGTAPQR